MMDRVDDELTSICCPVNKPRRRRVAQKVFFYIQRRRRVEEEAKTGRRVLLDAWLEQKLVEKRSNDIAERGLKLMKWQMTFVN